MHFTKMQGAGNDYVYVDCTKETVENPSEAAKLVSDRHFGIGADGLILIKPGKIADVEMEMYNADGSLGKMCGNGVRCVGKYAYDHNLARKDRILVETGAGIKILDVTARNGEAVSLRVNMGEPVLAPEKIPVDVRKIPLPEGERLAADAGRLIHIPAVIAGREWRLNCISMGNPHCVVFVDEVERFPLKEIGEVFECHPMFPERVNTEFAVILNEHEMRMRVWERGSGETWACGTGTCAAAAAAILNGLAESPVTVHLNGGDLLIEWAGPKSPVFMTGPAREVFEGDVDLERLKSR
ncbi:MAG: diaminopimelate epimerase [Lachnospiraceae bacterium]|nr:diaminopimelate epimerase [Lachnospiraceae bacterium]